MQELLNKFRAIRGVGLAAVVGSDGLVIESVHRPDVDADALAATATHGLLMAEALGRQMERGGALQTIIEYEEGVVLIEPLGDEGMILVVSDERTDLGRIRFTAKQYKTDLADALAAI
jgi:predicted regulator of Ras-like GTPase activity (Roadblock/LC7/MglB family)